MLLLADMYLYYELCRFNNEIDKDVVGIKVAVLSLAILLRHWPLDQDDFWHHVPHEGFKYTFIFLGWARKPLTSA